MVHDFDAERCDHLCVAVVLLLGDAVLSADPCNGAAGVKRRKVTGRCEIGQAQGRMRELLLWDTRSASWRAM
jgi:hypothetical protein